MSLTLQPVQDFARLKGGRGEEKAIQGPDLAGQCFLRSSWKRWEPALHTSLSSWALRAGTARIRPCGTRLRVVSLGSAARLQMLCQAWHGVPALSPFRPKGLSCLPSHPLAPLARGPVGGSLPWRQKVTSCNLESSPEHHAWSCQSLPHSSGYGGPGGKWPGSTTVLASAAPRHSPLCCFLRARAGHTPVPDLLPFDHSLSLPNLLIRYSVSLFIGHFQGLRHLQI